MPSQLQKAVNYFNTYAFDDIHHQNDAIYKTDYGGHLIDEVDMSWRVNQVNEMGFSVAVLENERHGRGLDGNSALSG